MKTYHEYIQDNEESLTLEFYETMCGYEAVDVLEALEAHFGAYKLAEVVRDAMPDKFRIYCETQFDIYEEAMK